MKRSPTTVKKWMERATTGGAGLSTILDRFSGTELTKDEWFDNVAIRYGRCPTNLTDQCDGCGVGLMLEHGLSCKRSGLIGIRHNDVCDEWAHLCSIALTDLQVVIKHSIFYGNGSRVGGSNATPTTPRTANPTNTLGDEAHGDVLAQGFWNQGRETVFDQHLLEQNPELHANKKKDK
ncbi:hypothetical protein ACHAW6_004392 [Cyclotella cf. meneghiniana]